MRATRVDRFARVGTSALPPFSVSALTQDRGHLTPVGPHVLRLECDARCTAHHASRHQAFWLSARGTCADDVRPARNVRLRTDLCGDGLARRDRADHRRSSRAQLHARHLWRGRHHLEAFFHAARGALSRVLPRTLASPTTLASRRRDARIRNVSGERRLDTTVDTPGEAGGAVGAGEIERRRPIRPLGSTRADAPGGGGARLLHATRQAASLTRSGREREREHRHSSSGPGRHRFSAERRPTGSRPHQSRHATRTIRRRRPMKQGRS